MQGTRSGKRTIERVTAESPDYLLLDLDAGVMDIVEGRPDSAALEVKLTWNQKDCDVLGRPKGSGLAVTRFMIENPIIPTTYEF